MAAIDQYIERIPNAELQEQLRIEIARHSKWLFIDYMMYIYCLNDRLDIKEQKHSSGYCDKEDTCSNDHHNLLLKIYFQVVECRVSKLPKSRYYQKKQTGNKNFRNSKMKISA